MISRDESFRPFQTLLQEWLAGARVWEIARVLELVGEELGRRGVSLGWFTDRPIK